MSKNKTAYFQGGGGVNEPTPKKKKYKSDPALVVQPRFKEPLYRNYDLYETEGVNGPAEHGPGKGYHSLTEYKSVSDFLKDRRKKLKDKYKADDSWIQDDGSITKKEPKTSSGVNLLKYIIKYAIDFPIDEQVTPILGDAGTYSDSIPIGGQSDNTFLPTDFEGKTKDNLNFGRDYIEDSNELDLNNLINKYINFSPIEGYPEPQEAVLSENFYSPTAKNSEILNPEKSSFNVE